MVGMFSLSGIEEIRKKIEQLAESDAKSLLMIIYARLDTALNGSGGEEAVKQMVKELFDLYSVLPYREIR